MGQMIERGEGTWLLRVYLGRVEGKRQYANKTFHGTVSQARKELTKMQGEKDGDTLVKPSKTTVKEFITSWLDGKANVSTTTKLDYQHRMEKDVYPFIGSTRMDQLTPAHIRILYGKLAEVRKLSPRTIRYTHTILNQALDIAVEDKVISSNPCKKKSVREVLPKQEKRHVEVLTAEQMKTLLEKTKGGPRYALWRLMLSTGLRPQEALVLKWEDLTETDVAIWLNVRRALHKTGKGKYEVSDATKTQGSTRSLVIDPDTAAELQAHKKVQAAHILKMGKDYQRNGYMFASEVGTYLDMRNVQRWWEKDSTKAGIPVISLYEGTRHTHLSHYLDVTGNAKATAERAGHKDPAMTLRTYAHTLPGTHESAVLDFAARLRKAQ